MTHSHDHSHEHGHRTATTRRLVASLVLAASYMLAEVVGGFYTGSLALLADAGHMLSDVAALALALGAMWLARKPAVAQRTFGNHRAEVLAALANAIALALIGLVVLKEALERWSSPPDVLAAPMLAIAGGGLVVNIIALLILHGGQKDSLNVRGAFLHVVADALGSVGAMVSGALIWAFGWRWADPLASFIIAGLVLFSAWVLLKQTAHVLMEAAPDHLPVDDITHHLSELPHVQDVHDLHAWSVASGRDLLTAHLVLDEGARSDQTLQDAKRMLEDKFSLQHVTLQVERSASGCACSLRPSSDT